MSSHAVTDAWDVDSRDFPRDGSPQEQLAFALRYAVLAPSGHNTQPWRFRITGDSVEVHEDRLRTLPVVDPSGRELVLSCGAALFFLRVALHNFGFAPDVALMPDPAQEHLLARVHLGDPVPPTADEAVLAQAILRRHTNRHAFEERDVPIPLVAAIARAAAAEGAWLEPVTSPEGKRAIAALVADAQRIQLGDPAFRAELAAWVRADGTASHGVPLEDAGAVTGAFPLRSFKTAAGHAESEQELANGSPLIAVLGTDADDRRAWIACGQALGHALLRAYSEGLQASFLNQPVEVASLRPLVAEAVGRAGHAHVVLRIGYGPPAESTPRRPLEDVLIA